MLTIVATVLVLALATIIATDSVRFGGDDRPSLGGDRRRDAARHARAVDHVDHAADTAVSRQPHEHRSAQALGRRGLVRRGARPGPRHDRRCDRRRAALLRLARVERADEPHFFDWPALAAKEMTAVTPEIVVFIISTNDYPVALNKTLDASGEFAWKAPYTKEVDDMMKTLEGSGRTVLWLGAPVLGDTKQNNTIKELNTVEKEVAKKHPTVVYFDTYALFADADGKYSVNVTDSDGKTITARSGDGVHLTMDGANYLARGVQGRRRAVQDCRAGRHRRDQGDHPDPGGDLG